MGKIQEKDIILLDKFRELVHIGDHFGVVHSIRDVLDDIPAVMIDSELSYKFQNGLGFRFNPPNEFANPDSEIREFDNTIELFIPNESTFQYVIKLNDTETVTLDFLAELTKIPCNITYYTPTGVVYNTQNLELREGSSLEFITDIEL